MRAVNLLIICGTLLSLCVPLIKAEEKMSESLGRRPGLQRMPKVRPRGVMLEDNMPLQYSQVQQSRRVLEQHDETGQGEAHQTLLRKARVLTGSSGSRSSSSSSSSSRSSSSSSSRSSSSSPSRSSSSSSSSSPPRSSWSSWFSPSRSTSPGATQARASPAAPSKPATQSTGAGQGTPATAAKGSAQPRSSYVPPSYHGPTVRSASGAQVVSNRLTTGYPTAGVSSRIPRGYGVATSAPRQTFYANRPYTHTYPRGYTLVFVSAHSPYYTGNHWAVYDNSNNFYGYDDNDVTSGDYDYDDDHDLPAGCQYMDPQSFETDDASSEVTSAQAPGPAGADVSGHVSTPASAPGSAVNAKSAPGQATAPSAYTGRRAVLSASPTYTAPAPAPGIAPGNAISASATGTAALSGNTTDAQGQGNLLCRPIAAKEDAPSGMSRTTKIIISVVVPVAFVAVFFCIVCACLR